MTLAEFSALLLDRVAHLLALRGDGEVGVRLVLKVVGRARPQRAVWDFEVVTDPLRTYAPHLS